MKPNGLLVSVAVLAVLGGLVWWSNKKQDASAKTTDKTTKILSIPDDQFQEIRIQKVTGEVQDLKRENGTWQMTEPKALPADQDAAGSMVSNLGSLNADKVVEEKATDFKPYGLATPTLDIRVKRTNGKTSDLLIGDDTPTGGASYARLKGDPRVFTIASYVKSSLDKTDNDLRDKRLMTFDQDKISRVELQAKGQSMEFGKTGGTNSEWQILKPQPLRADGSTIDTLVGKLKDAKMDLTGTPEEPAKKFAAAQKVAVATVTDPSGNQSIEVRRDKDKNAYAKSSTVAGIYKVDSSLADAMDKSVDDFRNKKLFDFGFSDPTKVELKNVTYTKSGDKWMCGAKPMDNGTVQDLIDKLRDLSATKFATKGGGNPVFEAGVTSNDGKRVEKITILQQGSQYFAQRANEPSIYELDGKTVGDLQKTAAAVKEAPTAPKKK